MQLHIKFQRSRACFFLLTAMLAVLAGRFFFIQIIKHGDYRARALEQQEDVVVLDPERGTIYDRNGSPLTINMQSTSVFANPREITDKAGTARALSKALCAEYGRTLEDISGKRCFAWIKRKIDDSEAAKVESLKLKGIYFMKEPKRVYLKGELAAHILGFTGLDNKGLEGVEKAYDKYLAGTPVKAIVQKDGTGKIVFFKGWDSASPEKGGEVTLTIDGQIQNIAQNALGEAFRKSRAKSAVIIIMDPKTGEILALASEPGFDPNKYRKYPVDSWRNRALTDSFEPGSTFKIVTAGAALEENIINSEDRVNCENGLFKFEDRTIRDVHKHRSITFSEVIEFSSNIGITKVGMRMGKDKLYQYIRSFGFGDVTGIGLGECSGIVRPLQKWSKVSIVAIPYGQEISATPVQLISAVSAVANSGMLMKPQIIKIVKDPGGKVVYDFKPVPVRQVISAKTSHKLTRILEKVVEDGTGTEAKMKGYRVAGKTGTAEKIDPVTRCYHPDKFASSFVGYFPAEDPRVVMYVLIDEPRGDHYGGVVAAPVFRKVAYQLISLLGIQPRENEKIDAYDSYTVISTPQQKRGSGSAQYPSDAMPDLAGKTMKRALDIMKDYSVKVDMHGSGIAVSQSPPPGAEIKDGQVVSITFGHKRIVRQPEPVAAKAEVKEQPARQEAAAIPAAVKKRPAAEAVRAEFRESAVKKEQVAAKKPAEQSVKKSKPAVKNKTSRKKKAG